MYWLLFLWQKLGRSWWRIWRKKMNKQHFFASFSQCTAPPLPELVPADSRRADQDQGTLLVWLQSESQRSVKKCWMKRGLLALIVLSLGIVWHLCSCALCRLKDGNVQNKLSNLLRKNAERNILSFVNLKFMQIVATWPVAYLSGSIWEAKLLRKSSVNLPPNMFTLEITCESLLENANPSPQKHLLHQQATSQKIMMRRKSMLNGSILMRIKGYYPKSNKI